MDVQSAFIRGYLEARKGMVDHTWRGVDGEAQTSGSEVREDEVTQAYNDCQTLTMVIIINSGRICKCTKAVGNMLVQCTTIVL